MPSAPINVLIADDDPTFRRFVRALIESEEDMNVVAEASDGEQAIALASEFAPNVVLMDIRMPKLSGIDATRELNDIHPSAKVLMLSVSDDESDLFEAIKAGASGYLLKDADPDGLAVAVRRAYVGQAALTPSIAAKLIPTFADALRGTDLEDVLPHLTAREFEVLQLLGDGRTTAQVAESLGTSEATVNSYIHNVLHKLHRHLREKALLDEHFEVEELGDPDDE